MIAPGMFMGPPLGWDRAGSLLTGLLAAPAPRTEWDPRLLINSLFVVGTLLIGAILIAMVNRWRRGASNDTLTASDQLAHFRSLYEKGEISQEEFQRLRSLLGGRIRASVLAEPKPSAPTETQTIAETPRPPESPKPHNPSGSSDPPETGIRPA